MEAMAEIELETRYRRLLHVGGLDRWLRQLTVLVIIHDRVIRLLVPAGDLERFPLDIRDDVLYADIGAASRLLQLDVFRLGLLAEGLLHLPLHLILEVLNVLRHLNVGRHEVVLLRQLRDVIVRQLIGRRTDHVVLLLAEDSAGRVFRYVRYQPIQFRECLITRVTVIVILALQLAERPAAALLGPVESMRRTGAHRRHDRRFCNVRHSSECGSARPTSV